MKSSNPKKRGAVATVSSSGQLKGHVIPPTLGSMRTGADVSALRVLREDEAAPGIHHINGTAA